MSPAQRHPHPHMDSLYVSDTCGTRVQCLEEDETLQQAVEALRLANDGAATGGSSGAGKKAGVATCRMDEALEPIISAGQAIAEFDGVEFEYAIASKLPLVQADTRVLQEAVSNVLDNALKYVLVRGDNPSSPRVSLSIQPCKKPLKGVEVVIQDNGSGVVDEELKMLCQESFRGQRCEHLPGTGLGLHITQQLVDLLNGKLLLEPVGQGSGLRVRIQMNRAP
jgi:signal transduction histidine kinase